MNIPKESQLSCGHTSFCIFLIYYFDKCQAVIGDTNDPLNNPVEAFTPRPQTIFLSCTHDDIHVYESLFLKYP